MRYVNSAYNAGCPICLYSKNKLLYKVSSTEAAMHFLVTQRMKKNRLAVIEQKIAHLWNATAAAIVTCMNCSFTFADPYVAGDHEFYNLLPHGTAESDENWKWEFDQTFKKIAGIVSNQNELKLLEIGANTGDFVKRISGLIPKKNILCLEYSQVGIDCIRK